VGATVVVVVDATTVVVGATVVVVVVGATVVVVVVGATVVVVVVGATVVVVVVGATVVVVVDATTVVVGATVAVVSTVSEVPLQAEANRRRQTTTSNFFIYTSVPYTHSSTVCRDFYKMIRVMLVSEGGLERPQATASSQESRHGQPPQLVG
jgi:hypothetical protein